jgi:conjugative relaxase-like TrwC/TraI family protein
MIRRRSLVDRQGAYYLEDRAPEVTDLFAGRRPGVWLGEGSARFGLGGVVGPAELGAVLSGQPPGSTLRPDPRRRRSAHDLVVAATKPVSVLFASEDPSTARQVVLAHERAVEVVLGYLERRAAVVRRSERSEVVARPAEGLVAAAFTQGISRSGDPHLHTHVVVANLARDDEGRFGALDGRALDAHRSAADALYRAHLRVELVRRLGVRWERGPGGAELIAGVSDAEAVALSGRAAEARAGLRVRPAKVSFASRDEAEDVWAERRHRQPHLADQPRSQVRADVIDEHRFAGLVALTSPTSREVVVALAESAPGGIDAGSLERAASRLGPERGHGLGERRFAARAALPGRASLRLLGPRPTGRNALEAWWRRSESLERRSTERALSASDRRPLEIGRDR